MALPDNMDLTTLLVEKCKHSGASWLHRLSGRTEEQAVDYLSTLQNRYHNFYSSLTKEEVFDNLSELIYQLSVDGSHILGIALYKELKAASLEEAHHKQKEIMDMRGKGKLAENLLLQMKNRAANANTSSDMDRLAIQMNGPSQPVKKHLLALLLLAVATGIFAYLSVDARQKGNFHNATQYTLFATFSAMAVVVVLLYNLYNAYLKRRRDRGEVINKG